MTLRLLALLVAWLFAQDADAADYQFDQAGNAYPVECQHDLTKDPVVIAAIEARHVEARRLDFGSEDAAGFTVVSHDRIRILLNDRKWGWKADDAWQHELCHAKLALIGKDPNWHIQRRPLR